MSQGQLKSNKSQTGSQSFLLEQVHFQSFLHYEVDGNFLYYPLQKTRVTFDSVSSISNMIQYNESKIPSSSIQPLFIIDKSLGI